MTSKVEVNHRVMYNREYLRVLGLLTSKLAKEEGIVVGFSGLGRSQQVLVKWGFADGPSRINPANLRIVGWKHP